jgi:photosystem II stability/assembly factor-like uncharacterized protein
MALLSLALPLALLPLAPRPAASAYGGQLFWQPLPAYSGSQGVRRVFLGQAGQARALYAVGATSGLAYSLDGGASWAAANTGLPRGRLGEIRVLDLAYARADPTVMYAAIDAPAATLRPMLYWTVDGGLHWQPRANLGRERVRALAVGADSAQLYIATVNDVRRAYAADTDSPSPATPQQRYARDRDDLRYEIITAFERTTLASLLMLAPPLGDDALGAPRLYVGAQSGGLTWLTDEGLAVYEALDADSRYVRQEATLHALYVHGAAPQRLYAGTERGLYASDDAGETWQRMGSALEGQRVLCLYIPPTAPDTLLAGLAGGGVWFSQDDGVTWEPLGRGLGRVSVYALTLDELAAPPVLYAATSVGLWRLVLDV